MKSIVNSQLTGKWYKLTRDPQSRELKFMEIFIYLSVNKLRTTDYGMSQNHLDLLYVGVEEDRRKILKKMSLKNAIINGECYIIVRRLFFRKKFKILLFDEENGVLILSDKKMKNISIYSRRYKVTLDVLENYLKQINFTRSVKFIIEDLNI